MLCAATINSQSADSRRNLELHVSRVRPHVQNVAGHSSFEARATHLLHSQPTHVPQPVDLRRSLGQQAHVVSGILVVPVQDNRLVEKGAYHVVASLLEHSPPPKHRQAFDLLPG